MSEKTNIEKLRELIKQHFDKLEDIVKYAQGELDEIKAERAAEKGATGEGAKNTNEDKNEKLPEQSQSKQQSS